MPKSPFSRLRASLSKYSAASNKRRRVQGRRELAFESLERRELLSLTTLGNMSVSENTGEKPQSKIWEYNDQWYSVMPHSGATWVWSLNGTNWEKQLEIAADDGYHADVKVDGNLAHVLLFDGTASRLATVQFDQVDNRYEMWSLRPSLVNVAVNGSAETAVIDIDSTGRMWVAYDTSSTIEVRYADAGTQYTNWSSPITVASGIKSDDIGTLIALPNGTIGVMWSDQNTDRFGFRIHVDGTNPSTWLNAEVAAGQSAQNKGSGMADDHINLAVASDGTVYAAVKTGYDSSGYPRMALLVRRPSGQWDDLYQVDTVGTRPIVMISEAANKIIVAYTQSNSGGNIYYKESPLQNISFGPRQTLIGGSVNNVSSVKAPFVDDVVAIASSGSSARGVLYRVDGPIVSPPPPTNLAPNVNAGQNQTIQLPASASLDGTVTDDGNPTSGTLTTSWSFVSGPGTVTFGNASAIDTTASFSQAGTYVLRLTANDGALQASDTVTIVVQAPATPPTNQAPNVNAGPDRTIGLGASASLDGTVTDDGLPSNSVTTTWTKVSGPGTVTFGNASAVDTSATFSQAGTYVLRLTASDGSLSASDTMTVVVNATSDPVTVSFQDGVSGYNGTRDTKIASNSANTNYGAAASIDVDGRPDVSDLLYWDLSQIPSGSVVDSVTIQLNITNTTSQSYALYQMLRAWDETSATWNQAANGSPWSAAGAQGTGDHATAVLGALAASSKGLYQITLNAAGIAAVQAWIDDPSANHGLIIQDYSNSSGADFTTREGATASQRPRLTVTYRPSGPIGNPPPVNEAPSVNAGADQTIQLPNAAALSGTVTDDGLPSGTLTRTWSKISGPGTVTFGNASSNSTTASFSQAGTYVLRLTASDGSLSSFDEVAIVVQAAAPTNQAPTVNAGADQTIQLPNAASLSGTVTDDGLPSGTLTRTWSKMSGPGTVTFGNASANSTTASFSQAGTYVLRLTASDGTLSSFDEVTIVVQAAATVNQAPTVNAGQDQSIQLPNSASLTGTVTDDGLPSGALTRTWSKISGPGTVTFGNASSNSTTASFSQAGTYVLRLTASDGTLSSFDEVTIVVAAAPLANQAPNVDAGPNRTIGFGASASLDGTVTDDGLPSNSVTTTWTKVSGPGTVNFANASAVDTTATFSQAGTYVLRLTANDGSLSASDTMTVVVNATSDPVTVSFQDGVSGYNGTRDTRITTKSQNTNYGSAVEIDFDGSPDVSVLLAWDLSQIPVGSVVDSVSIQLNITNTSSQAYELYEMLRAWSETTATWNQAASGSAWAAAGAQGNGDHGTTAIGSITATSKGFHQIVLNAAGIAAVQRWIDDPSANHGLIIQDYSNSSGADFTTRETSSVSERPRLTITYRPESGSSASGGEEETNTPPPVENEAPVVNAGANQTIQLPASASLGSTVTDDGLPSGSVTRTWSKVSGPGAVTFGNATANNTTASFSSAGTYVLRLTASDGDLSSFDEVTIVVEAAAPVNQAPVVNAGTDQSIQLPALASLSGTVTDDGLPTGAVTRTWSKVVGPGTVTFDNASANSTSASFSAAGTYVLRLTASDGDLQSFDEVTIVVAAAAPVNQPPIVNAGANQTIQLPALANLSATVTDTDGPLTTPLLLWTRVSGPGAVTFGNASSASTTASFSVQGTYVLRLTANDGDLEAFDELTITVLAEPNDPEPTPEPEDETPSLKEKLRSARRGIRG